MIKKLINEYLEKYVQELIEQFPELRKYENYYNVAVSVLGARDSDPENTKWKKLITFYYKENDKKQRKSFIIYEDKVEELS